MLGLEFRLNGSPTRTTTEPQTLLLELLRGGLGLTGTHSGCDTAQCGACTVLLDGQAVKSCSLLALQVQGRSVTTVEGLAGVAGNRPEAGGTLHPLHPLQEAFINCHGLQCGFCTPGMLMAATCLLAENSNPTQAQIAHALEGNLCRCTGYVNIVAAVRQAADVMAAQGAAA